MAAIVLAGGASRRMGRDKATLLYDAGSGPVTLVEHVVSVVAQRCDPVFVMAAQGQPLPELPVPVLRDEVRGVGPLLATGRGLRAAAAAGCERAFVCAVDMPHLTVDLIDDLARRRGADVVLPWDGRDHYLAAIYSTALVPLVDALIARGERSMRALADAALTQRIVMARTPVLANVNSPADLG